MSQETDSIRPLSGGRGRGGRAETDGRVGAKDLHFDPPHARGDGRVPELDSLRGLAALAVVVYHIRETLLPCGWAAVDLFFVLSGYLITAIILKHGKSPGFLLRFYVRRSLRVWPIYYLLIALLAALSPALYAHCVWRGGPYVLTFTQGIWNYWSGRDALFSPYLGHTWTLAIEEQFYLVWPAMILLLGRGRVVPLALACLAGSILVRSRAFAPTLLASRGDGLALGGLLAAVFARYRPDGPRRGLLLALFAATAIASLVPLAMSGAFTNPHVWEVLANRPIVPILAFNTLWFGVVGLIVCQAGRPWLAALRLRPLRDLGLISYGLYLYHFPVIVMTKQAILFVLRVPMLPLIVEIMVLITCLVTAWFSWIYIERPILGLKDRFAYRRPTATAHAARAMAEGKTS